MNQKRVDWVTELSEHFGRMVYVTAYRVLGNHQDAEDILQDVFLKLLGGWGKRIQPETVRDWGAYLRVTALRCAIDLLRKKPRNREESWSWQHEIETPGEENPRNLASRKQKARFLREALRQLPDRDAKVFAMRYFEELSYEEIADHEKTNINQVGVILHRTREHLKEILHSVVHVDKGPKDTEPVSLTTRKEIHHA